MHHEDDYVGCFLPHYQVFGGPDRPLMGQARRSLMVLTRCRLDGQKAQEWFMALRRACSYRPEKTGKPCRFCFVLFLAFCWFLGRKARKIPVLLALDPASPIPASSWWSFQFRALRVWPSTRIQPHGAAGMLFSTGGLYSHRCFISCSAAKVWLGKQYFYLLVFIPFFVCFMWHITHIPTR